MFNKNTSNLLTGLLTFSAFCTLVSLHANAAGKVYSPYVEKGELEIEAQNNIQIDDDNDKDGFTKSKLGVGYGFTDRFAAEIYGEWEKSGEDGSKTEFTAASLETRYQLFERGEHFIDVGLYGEYEVSFEDNGSDKFEAKLLFEKDLGKFANILNLSAEREVGKNSNDETETGLAWSTRYLYSNKFQPGFEWHSNFGAFSDNNSYDEQSHQVGPVIYGKLFDHVKYDIGYLFGASEAAPDGEFKTIIEYEMHF